MIKYTSQTSILDQCHPQWHLQEPGKKEKKSFCVTIAGEKKMGPNQLVGLDLFLS